MARLVHSGQLSMYLKPMVLVILSVLFIVMLIFNLNFVAEIQNQRDTFELRVQAPNIKNNIVSCLLGESNTSKSEILIQREKLIQLDEFYKFREPECMEDFSFGWNATILQEFLTGSQATAKEEDASIVLIIDGSGSMSLDPDGDFNSKFEDAKKAAKEFVDIARDQDRIGIVQFSLGAQIEQTLTPSKSVVNSSIEEMKLRGSGTSLGDGIQAANDELERNGEGKLYEILLTDGCPNSGAQTPTPRYQEKVKKAKELGITIFTIGFGFGDSQSIDVCTRDQAIGFLDEIAEETEGKRFLADDLEDLKEVYRLIAGEVELKKSEFGLEGSTCTLIPKKGVKGHLDIAFLLDTTSTMTPETSCSIIDELIADLESSGLIISYKVFSMPEGPDISVWSQEHNMFNRKIGEKHWSYRTAVVPSCNEELTEWSEDIVFNPFKDAKPEGWGVGSDYILDNHVWNGFVEKLIVIFGDQDPTGGCNGAFWNRWNGKKDFALFSSPEDLANPDIETIYLDVNCENDYGELGVTEGDFLNPWRTHPYKELIGDFPEKPRIGSELQVMDRILKKAEEEEVTFYFLNKREYVLEDQYEGGNEIKNDAIEAMENVAHSTGGELFPYGNWQALAEHLKDKFTTFDVVDSIDSCTNVYYSFGESQGSYNNQLEGKIQWSFPVTIQHTPIITTPGTLFVEIRDGPLERLAGEINRVVETGERDGVFESTFFLNTDAQLEIKDAVFNRPKRVNYTLSGGTSPADSIFVDEDIVIGVDGVEVFKDEDGFSTDSPEANYTGVPVTFDAIRGHSFQVLGFNFDPPRAGIGPLYLHCCGGQVQQFHEGITADMNINASEYGNLTKNINFFFNFTTLEIGESEDYVGRAICMISSGEERCVNLRIEEISPIVISPGEYFIKITYVDGVVEVSV